MDILTSFVMLTTAVVIATPVVLLAMRRPDAFGQMLAGARPFAEGALAESAALRAKLQPVEAVAAAPAETEASHEEPALAA